MQTLLDVIVVFQFFSHCEMGIAIDSTFAFPGVVHFFVHDSREPLSDSVHLAAKSLPLCFYTGKYVQKTFPKTS